MIIATYSDADIGVEVRVTKLALGLYHVDVIDTDANEVAGTRVFKLADAADAYARSCVQFT